MTPYKFHNQSGWDAAVLDAKRLVARVEKCQAYQFADGFDNYNTASTMYSVNQTAPIYSSAYRRFAPPAGLPGQGIKFSGAAGASITRNLSSNQATLIIKIAANFPSFPASANPFLIALDSGVNQWALQVTSAGALQLLSGGTVQATTPPGVMSTNAWYGIEAEVTIANGTGTAAIWLNGIQVINASGLYTQYYGSSGPYANQVAIGDVYGNGIAPMFDDFRVWDNTGTYQNVAAGALNQDTQLVTELAAGAGAFTQFSPNGAAANWQCVDDNPPDGDTTYVSGATVGLQDAYAMQNPGLAAAPLMVLARSYARKDDSNPRQLAVGVSSVGVSSVGPTVTLGSTYQFIDGCIPLDPNTVAVWTAAGANAAQHYKEEIL
jgi:hypothetical protein